MCVFACVCEVINLKIRLSYSSSTFGTRVEDGLGSNTRTDEETGWVLHGSWRVPRRKTRDPRNPINSPVQESGSEEETDGRVSYVFWSFESDKKTERQQGVTSQERWEPIKQDWRRDGP